MPIINVQFDVSAEILARVTSGELQIIGGVVRYAAGPNKGQIFKLLKPVDLKQSGKVQNGLAKVKHLITCNKLPILIVGSVVLFIASGTFIVTTIKKHKPKVVRLFNIALGAYIGAARKGELTLDHIEALMSAIDEMKAHKDYDKFKLEIPADDLAILVDNIYEGTIKLSRINNIELDSSLMNNSDDPITDLHNYLAAQKSLFEIAA